MPERPRKPEAKTPLDTAVDAFFEMARQKTSGETHIRFILAALLTEGTTKDCPRQKYIDNWSSRFAYDIDGTLMYVGTVDNESTEDDDDVPESEVTNDKALAEEVFTRRIEMVTDVTAFFVASQYSTLERGQKRAMLDHAEVFLSGKGLEGELQERLGNAVAPYVANEIDLVLMGDDREHRVARGRAVLDIMDRSALMHNGRRADFARRLRRAAKS